MNLPPLYLLLLSSFVAVVAGSADVYQEELLISQLTDGKLLGQFRFTTSYRGELKHLRWENKIQLFPLAIADLVAETDLQELHFSLTKGNWRYRHWGYPARPSPPGAQIRVMSGLSLSWNRLLNLLAGNFCASLISALKTSTIRSTKTSKSIFANLPEETFCTENLTPWRKLLPFQKSGLSTLLSAVKLLDSSYSSLAIDLEPKDGRVNLTQTITIVFNPLQKFEGKQVWSLAKIFGSSISKACPIASHSKIIVDTLSLEDKSKLYPQNYTLEGDRYAVYDLNSILAGGQTQLNIGVKQTQLFKRPPASSRPELPVYLNTHVSGVGAGEGAIVATITNRNSEALRLTYTDAVPHFLRLYIHTLSIRTSTGHQLEPDKVVFEPSDGTSPTLIEFSLLIPASTDVRISYEFERSFLRWSDYRPDAHRGILISSAQISFSLAADSDPSNTAIYARPLLIILPTPDFSMPYNVICLVCTVLVAAFGPLFSMTTTKPTIKLSKKEAKKEQ